MTNNSSASTQPVLTPAAPSPSHLVTKVILGILANAPATAWTVTSRKAYRNVLGRITVHVTAESSVTGSVVSILASGEDASRVAMDIEYTYEWESEHDTPSGPVTAETKTTDAFYSLTEQQARWILR